MVPPLGFIGTGRVAAVLARAWHSAGYHIGAVYNRSRESAAALAELTGARNALSAYEVVDHAGLIFLTVPDDQINDVVSALRSLSFTERSFVHTSGVHSMFILNSLMDQGAHIGSLHPAFPVADASDGRSMAHGSTYALEASSLQLRDWLRQLVNAMEGRILEIPSDKKALYHAALVIVSNYMITLYALGERLLIDIGADQRAVDHALNMLVAGAVENLRRIGIPGALTGPLVRSDVNTIRRHLDALAGYDPRILETYIRLAELTYPLLKARNVDIHQFEHLFQQDT